MSFQYIHDTLDKQILRNFEFKDDLENLHIILVNDVSKSSEKMDMNTVDDLRNKAQQLAER